MRTSSTLTEQSATSALAPGQCAPLSYRWREHARAARSLTGSAFLHAARPSPRTQGLRGEGKKKAAHVATRPSHALRVPSPLSAHLAAESPGARKGDRSFSWPRAALRMRAECSSECATLPARGPPGGGTVRRVRWALGTEPQHLPWSGPRLRTCISPPHRPSHRDFATAACTRLASSMHGSELGFVGDGRRHSRSESPPVGATSAGHEELREIALESTCMQNLSRQLERSCEGTARAPTARAEDDLRKHPRAETHMHSPHLASVSATPRPLRECDGSLRRVTAFILSYKGPGTTA
ncbi:hypothetical protein DMC30DRAFT_400893 [Rhodotorula diobovata]|uniref:Uncharacterized protein n=1 Tax=Rhodotorula diobovata TaxID=5288 RepID=A0A5C5FQZ0_9BASI|nr:hypothetical protein DMC30DRAFT_400893 [Rhodotorula diobovata]